MEKILEKLGLGNKEQIIYKLILERGKIAPALIEAQTHQAVHQIVDTGNTPEEAAHIGLFATAGLKSFF